ncbi:MAG: inositol monophosphatase family protein [Catalinimonas sp.]
MNLETLCNQVAELARETGGFIREERRNFRRDVIEFKGRNDLVSYVDKEAERRLVVRLRTLLPEATFITEEGTTGGSNERLPGYQWVIDPLDGTTNFVHNFPPYSTSIGLLHDGRPVLGVVYEVVADECFWAWEGGGAYLNGEHIRVSPENDLVRALTITGFPYQMFDDLSRYLNIFTYFVKNTHGLRRLGSAAVDLAYVAAGRGEAFFEYNLKPWDVAGGVVLVREAGGTVTDFSGGDDAVFGKQLIAAGPVHETMRRAIAERWFAAK